VLRCFYKTCEHPHRAFHRCQRWTSFLLQRSPLRSCRDLGVFHRCRRFFVYDLYVCNSSLAISMKWLWRWICKPVFSRTLWWILTLQLLLTWYAMDTVWTRNISIPPGAISHHCCLLFILYSLRLVANSLKRIAIFGAAWLEIMYYCLGCNLHRVITVIC
jgi:hypothetical protein